MINIEIVVEDEVEFDKVNRWLVIDGLPFKARVDVFNREDNSTTFYKQLDDGRLAKDEVCR